MTQKSVKVKRLHPDVQLPQYAHDGDSGFDLVAVEDVIVEPGQTVKVRTGLAFSIPTGYELQIRPRSGITSKTKLRVQLGTVDSSYRGEVSVMVDNVSQPPYYIVPDFYSDDSTEQYYVLVQGKDTFYTAVTGLPVELTNPYDDVLRNTYIIRKGDRIAQAVIAPVIRAELLEVDELDSTERGDGGFGSTGV